MFTVQQKRITRHIKEQKSMARSKEKKSTETVPKKDLVEDILDKDFKIIVLKMAKYGTKMWKKSRKRCVNKMEI